MSMRSSLNLIYTMSRSIATLMSMDEDIAAEIVCSSSEIILQEALDLYDRIHTAAEIVKKTI